MTKQLLERYNDNMLSYNNERRAHYLFLFVMIWRGVYGVFEVALGTALLFTASVAHIAHSLVQGELVEDPTDMIAQYVSHTAQATLNSGISFAAFYLIGYGAVKIFLLIGILRNKLWAYPTSIAVFLVFITYQLYRFAHTHSVVLFLVTLTDIFAVLLIWHEYRHPFTQLRSAEKKVVQNNNDSTATIA